MSLTAEQAFKIGFLLKCAEAGMTIEETTALARAAANEQHMLEKQAIWPLLLAGAGAAKNVLGVGGALLPAAAAAAVGIPATAGALGGYTAAKMTADNGDELSQAKQDEIEGEYYRLAQEARRNAMRKRLQAQTGRKVTLLSPTLR